MRRKQLASAIGLALAVGVAGADFPPAFDLADLNGTNGSALNGAGANAYAGQSVAAAGDFNGDGIDDFLVGAPYSSNGLNNAGVAYIVFGSAQGLPDPLNLSALGVGTGLAITGTNEFDSVGFSVSSAGDVNGDGIGDVIVGGPGFIVGENYTGGAFVVFGTDQGLPASLNVSSLDGEDGFAILGNAAGSYTGTSVSGSGDVNGDGIDDLVLGAPYTNTGTAYVVFGSDGPWAASLSVGAINGTNGFRIDGVEAGDMLGISVASAGDVNGDGIDDLVIGASLAGTPGAYAGAAYVVFGSDSGFTHPLDVSTLDGTNGFTLVGVAQGDSAGHSVSAAGDINGDTIDDLIIGAPAADPNGLSSGTSYVVFGRNTPWASSLDLADLNGSNGFALLGAAAGDESGSAVSAAGDLDSDGFADLIVGAPLASPSGAASGAGYVVLGSNQAWPATVSLSGLNGTNGFRIDGAAAGDTAGTAVASAGDIDADGTPDLLLGAPEADPNGDKSGAGYLIRDANIVVGDLIFADGFEE